MQIEGEVLESVSDFYNFDYFVKNLPFGVTEVEINKLELLYNEVMILEKDELWEEAGELWGQINQITNPYYLANWEPEPFDLYLSMFDYRLQVMTCCKWKNFIINGFHLQKVGAEDRI